MFFYVFYLRKLEYTCLSEPGQILAYQLTLSQSGGGGADYAHHIITWHPQVFRSSYDLDTYWYAKLFIEYSMDNLRTIFVQVSYLEN